MKVLKINFNKDRAPIDLKKVSFYNRALQYNSGKLRVWNDQEGQQLKNAAPLLKFALGKEMRELELEAVKSVLSIACRLFIPQLVITGSEVKYFGETPVHAILKNDIFTMAKLEQSFTSAFNADHRISSPHRSHDSMVRMWVSMLPSDTDYYGMYRLVGMEGSTATFNFYENSKEIYSALFERGFSALPARVPLPTVVSKNEIDTAMDMARHLNTLKGINKWRDMLAKKLKSFHKEIRWKESDEFKKLLANL